MKISFWFEPDKKYIEFLPTITFGWSGGKRICVGWLIWFINLDL